MAMANIRQYKFANMTHSSSAAHG